MFDRRQKEAVTTLQQQETTPDFTAGRALTKLAYPDHPYGSGANVTAESIRKVNLDDIRAFHRSRYGKDNAIVAIAKPPTPSRPSNPNRHNAAISRLPANRRKSCSVCR